jgi:hypothetical protein
MANVFVSHRSSDETQAERLAETLRSAGHTVWLDTWEIGLGDSITEKMNQGLEGATFLVLCCSSAGVTSPWMSREWLSAIARQLNDKSIRILPVILSGGTPPAILADVKYADLVKDWDSGIAALLKALG